MARQGNAKMPYELSQEADNDLVNIFDYTANEFGVDQAVSYLMTLDAAFANISDHPKIGRERPDIRAGLRSLSKESHVIFYRILKDRVRIVRVLHVSRDTTRYFPPTA